MIVTSTCGISQYYSDAESVTEPNEMEIKQAE